MVMLIDMSVVFFLKVIVFIFSFTIVLTYLYFDNFAFNYKTVYIFTCIILF